MQKQTKNTQFGTRVLPVLVTWTRLTERWDRYIFRGRQNHTNECVRALVYEPLCSAWIDSQLGVPDQRRDRWTMGINHAVPIARCAEPSRRPSLRPGHSAEPRKGLSPPWSLRVWRPNPSGLPHQAL